MKVATLKACMAAATVPSQLKVIKRQEDGNFTIDVTLLQLCLHGSFDPLPTAAIVDSILQSLRQRRKQEGKHIRMYKGIVLLIREEALDFVHRTLFWSVWKGA